MKYDEYQLFTRYRLGYHTMFLTEILIVVNILLCMRRPWASTMVQMTALLVLPGLYFITGAVFRNAYLEIGARHWVHGLWSMGIGLLGILVFTVSDPVLLQDGMVTDDVIQLAVGICWLYLGAILLIKAYLNFRGEKGEAGFRFAECIIIAHGVPQISGGKIIQKFFFVFFVKNQGKRFLFCRSLCYNIRSVELCAFLDSGPLRRNRGK